MFVGDISTRGRGGGRRAWAVATTIGDLFDMTAGAVPDGEVVFPHERATYADLADRSEQMARSLHALGIRAGDKVGLMLVPGVDNLVAFGAIARIGAISVPINARFKVRELAHVLADSDMNVLLVSAPVPGYADYPGLLAETFPELTAATGPELSIATAPLLRTIVQMDGDGPAPAAMLDRAAFDALAGGVDVATIDRAQESVRVGDIAMIMYTSGTESNPKGCLLTHETFSRTAMGIAHTRFQMDASDRLWMPLPLFHCGGIVLFFACLSVGAGYVHAAFFDPAVALDQLEQEKVTIAHPAFETIWLAVLHHPRFATADLSAIRIVLAVGVPERLREINDTLPQAQLFNSFGATEACSHLALTTPEDDLEHRLTTGGHPLPGMQIRIVDPETGEDLPPDAEGEVLYRGPDLFNGYYKAEAVNAASFDDDGWFHSRDVGVLDPDGRLTFRSRLKDMLKVGGENVGAAEIENVLAEHPAVAIVQVVAAPDARYVEVPAAFVQLKDGTSATELELIEQCVGRIANFKVPRYVRFVTEWPMSGTKIRKVTLREQIAAELRAAGIDEAPALSEIRASASG